MTPERPGPTSENPPVRPAPRGPFFLDPINRKLRKTCPA